MNTLSDLASVYTNPKTQVTYTSLRAAISLANADGDSTESIGFSVSGTIYLNSSYGALPALAGKTFSMDGTGITVDAGGNSGIFVINSDATAEIDNIGLTNAANDPAVEDDGVLTFDGDTVSNCQAGAMRVVGSVNSANTTYSNLSFNGSGGAANINGASTFTDCTFDNDQATGTGGGGAIYSIASLTISGCTFSYNQAAGNGGAVVTAGGTNSITNTYMYLNSAAAGGGAIYVSGSLTTTTVDSGCSIFSNTASSGAGIYISSGSATVQGGTDIYANTASANGGGIYNAGTLLMQGGSTLYLNQAANAGGGLFNDTGGNATFYDTSITSNTTADPNNLGKGGGICVRGGTVTVSSGCEISSNTSDQGNGAYVFAGTTLNDNPTQNTWNDNIIRA